MNPLEKLSKLQRHHSGVFNELVPLNVAIEKINQIIDRSNEKEYVNAYEAICLYSQLLQEPIENIVGRNVSLSDGIFLCDHSKEEIRKKPSGVVWYNLLLGQGWIKIGYFSDSDEFRCFYDLILLDGFIGCINITTLEDLANATELYPLKFVNANQ